MKSRGISDPTAVEGAAFTWVDSPALLQAAAGTISATGRIAVDVEGDSLYHYWDKVCLLQISTDAATFVMDTLVLEDLSCLRGIMTDPAIEKVFHAAGQDIAWLRRDFGFSFRHIFDTHMAAQLLGHQRRGLDALLEGLLGVAHSKHLQRADWSHRPLSTELLAYAAMDTRHLLRLRDALEASMVEKGRQSWAVEEFEYLATSEYRAPAFDPEGYRKIPGSRALRPRQQAVLRTLWSLRDRMAREMDLPPFRVLNNAVLVVMARRMPGTDRELVAGGVPRRVAERYGTEILAAIDEARTNGSVAAPRPRGGYSRPSPGTTLRVRALKEWRVRRAQELDLPVGVVLPGGILSAIASRCPRDRAALGSLEGMRQWRVREFGEEILRIVAS